MLKPKHVCETHDEQTRRIIEAHDDEQRWRMRGEQAIRMEMEKRIAAYLAKKKERQSTTNVHIKRMREIHELHARRRSR